MLRNMVKSYTAKVHTSKTVSQLIAQQKQQQQQQQHHIFYIKGEVTRERHDTDTELTFRQESNFYYLTGCSLPGSELVVSAITNGDNKNIQSTLFIPPVNPLEVMWCGMPPSPDEVKANHDVDNVMETTSLKSYLSQLIGSTPNEQTFVHTLPDTKLNLTTELKDVQVDDSSLIKAIHEARTQKTPAELELMRIANKISSDAHVEAMKAVANGAQGETEVEAAFRYACVKKGLKSPAYLPIFAYSDKGATLHYVANDQKFDLSKPELMVIDAGFEHNYYASDITRTLPVGNNGKFSEKGRAIYEIVLDMQKAAFKMIKSGVEWESIQIEMHRVAAAGLLKLGILQPGPSKAQGEDLVQELVKNHASVPFFPHGIGHMLGLDTHDVGGLPEGRSKDPLTAYVRLRRTLLPGYVVTVEPGIYFNRFLVEPHKDSPYINKEVLETYFGIGGVRIEDNVVVTEDGFENLTSAPKEVDEVEKLCSSN